MNTFVVLFFDPQSHASLVSFLPQDVIDNFLVEFVYKGVEALALCVGRQSQPNLGPYLEDANKIIDNAEVTKHAVIYGLSYRSRETELSVMRVIKKDANMLPPVFAADSASNHMMTEFLRSFPPIWTGNLRNAFSPI